MSVPAIITYSLDHMLAALEAANCLNVEILILSAPGAAGSLGSGVFQSMVEQLRQHHPNATFTAALDCGADAGHALAAIRQGVDSLVLSSRCTAHDRIVDIANQNQTEVIDTKVYDGKADARPLDLKDHLDPLAACREFLHTRIDSQS